MENIEIEERIGKGAFGEVFLVRSNDDNHRYILKRIKINNKDELVCSIKEVLLLKVLDHPNIVNYVEAGRGTTDDGITRNIYILMEYCEKGDLAKVIAERNGVRFPDDEVLRWFSQMSSAVHYIHSLDVLHRDLKPANIFLTSKNIIKIGDFGIATVLENTMAKANTMCGTLGCTAPEVWKNNPYDKKCDIWSLGCVLFEMVTLQKAFPQTNIFEIVGIFSAQTVPEPTDCSEAITNIIKKMLKYSTCERAAIQDVINELQKMLPIEDHPKLGMDAICDACEQKIWNFRYKCLDCRDYDLCVSCQRKGIHAEHGLLRVCGDFNSKWVHDLVKCDECSANPIRGIRFKCQQCPTYNICRQCFVKKKHPEHKFGAICNPIGTQ